MRRAYVLAACLFLGCGEVEAPEEAPAAPAMAPAVEPVNEAPVAEPVPDTIALRHILLAVAHEGSSGMELEDALALAATLRERIEAGEDMGLLAVEYSTDPTGRRGGWLGAGQREAWVPEFSEAAWKLGEGELSPPVVTDFGVHLIRREALVEIHLKQVVVQYQGCLMLEEHSPASLRTEEEAWTIARQARERLEGEEDFATVALELSDGPMSKRGGDLGLFLLGELGPTLDRAVTDLEPGELSEIVQTPFGLHILLRY